MQDFIRKKEESRPGINVGLLLQNRPTTKDVGIEIEVEGKNFIYHEEVPNPWKYVEDHSLRGEENAEYVLKKPIGFSEVPKALDLLFGKLSEKGATFDDSNRTSVHVHLNCQKFYLNNLASFFAAWYAVEEVLTEWCGEYRVGNLFCLRAVDASALVTYAKKFLSSDGAYPFSEMLRYGALNPFALHKYGSLEVRTLQGCHEAKPIADWVAMLARLHNQATEFKNPTDIIDLFSSGGPISFFKKLLGDMAEVAQAGSGMDNERLAEAMFRGIRFAQQIAYCRDWSAYKPFEVKPCPFGRDTRKLVTKILAQETPSFEPEPEYDLGVGVPVGSPLSSMAQYVSQSAEFEVELAQTIYDPFNPQN